MNNGIKMFDATKRVIRLTLDELIEKHEVQKIALYGINDDGDASDDPLVKELRGEHSEREQRINRLRTLVENDDSTLVLEKMNEGIVSKGKKVAVIIVYPDGTEDELHVTIGSSLDLEFLSHSVNI